VTDVRSTTSKAAPASEAADLDREATRPFGTGPAEPAESGSGGASGASPTGAGWGRWAWRQLTSMRTALILLFLLALVGYPFIYGIWLSLENCQWLLVVAAAVILISSTRRLFLLRSATLALVRFL